MESRFVMLSFTKALLPLVILASCALPTVEPINLPSQIEAAIPADIDLSEVNRDPKGCYFYVYAGDLFQVKDADGNSICLSEGETS